MRRAPRSSTPDQAAALALRALAWLAADADRLGRFLALTGIGPAELRARANDPAILAAVLDHLLGHEADLLAFCAEAGVEAALPAQAKRALEPW
jgi:hypothetical protein